MFSVYELLMFGIFAASLGIVGGEIIADFCNKNYPSEKTHPPDNKKENGGNSDGHSS